MTILGLLIGMYMGLYNVSIALFFCLEIIVLFLGIEIKNQKLLITVVIMLLAFVYAKNTLDKYNKAFCDNENIYVAKIESIAEEVKNQNKYIARIKSGKYNNYRILLYTKHELEFGEVISFYNDIEKPENARNDKGFDYSTYLREKKIAGIVKIDELKVIKHKKDLKYYLFKFKSILYNRLDTTFDKQDAGFLKAILLGETSSLDDDIKENFKNANISHVLAISGMHISYIVLGLEIILKKIIKDIKLRNVIILIFLNIFAVFVGGSNSVCRACMMTSIVYIGKLILRKDDFFTSFKVVLGILLISNPYNIFSGSMWLSFGGSAGIVLYSKLIEKLALKTIKAKSHNNYKFLKKFTEKIVAVISVTLGAQIIVFPIMIYIFNTFSFNFIISNLLISELVGPILILGYASLLIPFLSVFEKFLIKIFFFVAKISANLPLNSFLLSTPSLLKIVIYYAILASLVYFWRYHKIYLMRKIRRFKLQAVVVALLILLVLFGNFQIPFRKNLEIHFLDVGQGDSCLIRTCTNKVILVDGGKGKESEYDYGEKVIIPYLLDHGISKIDYVLISHFDSDHAGGCAKVLETLDVENIILAEQIEKSDIYTEILSIAKKKNIKLIYVKAGDEINIDGMKLKILHPQKEQIFENAMNNNSVVCRLEYKDFSMLFTGDIEKIAEEDIVDTYKNTDILDVDVLKVAHHGSKSSSIEEMIEKVTPKVSIIGVGADNKYGHPNKDVLARLQNYGSQVFRTDENGEISIMVNRKGKIIKIDRYLK